MNEALRELLTAWGLPPFLAGHITETVEVVLVAAAAAISYSVAKQVSIRIIHRIAEKTKAHWDDRLVESGVFTHLAHIPPALVIHILAPVAFAAERAVLLAQRGADIYGLIAIVLVINALVSVAKGIYDGYEIARRFPIRVYVQVLRILIFAGALIAVAAVVTGRSPVLLLSGLGAMTAVLLLISRDSIQGLLAGIQLISNDMVRPGDWIEMPQNGADGDVVDITLHTVKVRNWDNTITTIPTFALISQSFKNWRGMQESAGRRIKRSILLDIGTVRFCDPDLLAGLKQIEILRDYITERAAEIAEHNRARQVDESEPANGRRLTNVGVFRQYLTNYLRAHPMINPELTLMVRQLQPTEYGLPLEIYAFSADKNWVRYEGIQADIFDHAFAALPQFGLRAYHVPSGHDAVRALSRTGAERPNGNRPVLPPAAPNTREGGC